ncbi:hypothetical protein QOZ80_7AG0553030 [Eleusine coracana subsp. coracana]|nr:hypothetical protein QOZ80_7AG0553030 [Eleusine coracana subsp. coracana]
MAETALSVARSILGSAISKAAAAAAEEMSLLMGVQKEIWFMKDELKTMQAFLIASEKMKRKKPLLKLMKLKDRHRIGVQIRNLKSRVEEVSSRNTRYNLIEMEDIDIDEAHSSMEDVRSHSASNIDEEELVGFETPKQVLLDMINTRDNDGHAQVICVVGMGGHTSLMKRLKELEGKGVQVEDLASYLREQLKEKRWIAEGLVRVRFGMTLEDVGESYFNELISRNKVDWFGNLTWLLKLCLVWTELKEGKAMEILGALPNLMLLHLLEIAYAGEELVFRPDTFLNLREFHIRRAIKLREIRFEQDASPQMESIEITDCILELGINGIKHLPKLKEISLSYKSEVAMQYKLQDEMKAHPNQPVLRRHQD